MSTLIIGKQGRLFCEPLFFPSDKSAEMCLVASLSCCVASDVVEGRGVKKIDFEICASIMKNWNNLPFRGVLGIIYILVHVTPYFIVLSVVFSGFIHTIPILSKKNDETDV